jgi:2-aminoadipate transaminase
VVSARGVSSPPFAARVAGINGSLIDDSTSLLQRQSHDVVRFAMGSAAEDAIPTRQLSELMPEVLGAGALDYGPTEGEFELRENLSAFLDERDGDAPPAERLLITAGGMQGLDLVCKLFVERGDLVATESPTYTNAISTITGYEGRVLEVPTDADGMQVELLPELCMRAGATPKLIYVIPNFQNPSGTTLSLGRREALLELAERWDAVVLEDDPYALLRFRGEPLPSLESLAGDRARVIGVRTFSKILAPGLRVGWLTAQPDVIELMIAAKQSMDTCTNVPMQRLVSKFLERGLLGAHLDRVRVLYRERKEQMDAGLAETFGDLGATWTDPSGGFFLWLELPEDVDTARLFPVAVEEGVAFVPGPAFTLGGGLRSSLRLCFATTAGDRMRLGLRRLRAALDRMSVGNRQ